MVSFTLRGGETAVERVAGTRVFQLAEWSARSNPHRAPRANDPRQRRRHRRRGQATLLRLSVGIEHVSDLTADLEQALVALT